MCRGKDEKGGPRRCSGHCRTALETAHSAVATLEKQTPGIQTPPQILEAEAAVTAANDALAATRADMHAAAQEFDGTDGDYTQISGFYAEIDEQEKALETAQRSLEEAQLQAKVEGYETEITQNKVLLDAQEAIGDPAARDTANDIAELNDLQNMAQDDLDDLAAADASPAKPVKQFGDLDRKERVDAMLKDIETEVANLGTGPAWKNYLDTTSKFHSYSFNNRMLIAMQKPDATNVAGFRQWQKNFDRSVNKGEKSIHILAPRVVKEKDKVTGEEKKKVVGFLSVSVFDASQTSGKPLPTPPVIHYDRATGTAPDGMKDDLTKAVTDKGFSVNYQDLGADGPDGFTRFTSNEVVINSRYANAHQVATLAHEMAHIELDHGSAAHAYHSGPGGDRPDMEVEAESTAYVIAGSYGLKTKESFSYIDSWAKGDPKKVKAAAERVSSAAHRILEKLGK